MVDGRWWKCGVGRTSGWLEVSKCRSAEVEPALVYWSQPGLDSRFSILDSRSRPRARSPRGGWLVDFPDMSSGSQTVSAPGSGAAGQSDWLRPPRPSGPPSLVCLCQRTRPPRIQPLSHSAIQRVHPRPGNSVTLVRSVLLNRSSMVDSPLLHGRLRSAFYLIASAYLYTQRIGRQPVGMPYPTKK